MERQLQLSTATTLTEVAMAARKQQQRREKRSDGKSKKTSPEKVSGISAAALEGAQEGAQSDNAEKMSRPGPGLADRRMDRESNSESVESTAGQSPPPRTGAAEDEVDAEAWRAAEDASPDDFEEFGAANER
jgi:hypothetical protein